MSLESLVKTARSLGASDLHLDPGTPPAHRIRGKLSISGHPISGAELQAMVRQLTDADMWAELSENRSLDFSRNISGVRCRINVLQTSRGLGLAIRLLSSFQATVESLNLHPSISELAHAEHGLVLVSGPTGSGKSSTIAALVHELNTTCSKHIVTIERPIEYSMRSKRSLIRQREVGRDTPSFEQALLDSLREDPDVIVVGELRRRETMRLTLSAAETGHLVFTTVHSSSCSEALHRLISAFPAEEQTLIAAQLADCLVGVVCQRLRYLPEFGIRIPECEILRTSSAARANIRQLQLKRLDTTIETGGSDGMWSWDRYQRWIRSRDRFFLPQRAAALPADPEPSPKRLRPAPKPAPKTVADGVIDLDAVGGDLLSALDELL